MQLRLSIHKKMHICTLCILFALVQLYPFALFNGYAAPRELKEEEIIKLNAFVTSFYEVLIDSPNVGQGDISKWFTSDGFGFILDTLSPYRELFGFDDETEGSELMKTFLETYGAFESIELVYSNYLRYTEFSSSPLYALDYKVIYKDEIIYDRIFISEKNGQYEIFWFIFDFNINQKINTGYSLEVKQRF